MGQQRARLAIGIAVGLLVVTGAVGAVLVFGNGDTAAKGGDPGTSVQPEADDAEQVVEALSHLASDPDSLVAASSQDFVAGRGTQAVPPDSEITADKASWAPDGHGGGVIRVTIDPVQGKTRSYAVLMVQESGQWKVMATFPITGTGPS